MRKLIACLAVIGLVLTASVALAESNLSTKKTSDKKSADKKTSGLSKEAQAVADKAKLEAERLAEINDSQWTVTIVKKGEDREKQGVKDRLIFAGEKLSFEEYFKKKGIAPVGFSLVLNPDLAGGTWETFMGAKDESTVSIRGDWHGTIMNGTIFEQSSDGKESQTYYFSSQDKVAIAPADAQEGVGGDLAAAASEASAGVSGALVSKENSEPTDSKEKRY